MELQNIDDMQAIIDVMPYPVFIKDRSHRMLMVNAAACAFFGHSREALLTHSDDLFPPEQALVFKEADEQVFSSCEQHESEEQVTDAAGNRHTVVTRKRRIRINGIDYLVASCADVTPYREADREQYFDLSLDLLCVATEDGYFKHVNPAFQPALGWTSDELLSQPFLNFVHPDDRAATQQQLDLLATGRNTEHFENRYSCSNGHYRWLAWKAVRGRDGLLYCAARDFTEIKSTHDMLAQAKRSAEAASHAKSAFLATMSHEIRTPMNGVLGMLEVLERSGLSSDQLEMTRTVRHSAKALLAIIDDILDFSKIEAGRLELERQPVVLGRLVEELAGTLVPVALQKNVRLHTFVSPDLPTAVLSDQTRLRQLLYNLAGNAIKFSGGRADTPGRVTIEVTISQRSPLRLGFRVTDNGIGISAGTLPSLFVPFSQAEVSTTRRFGGTGLGLAICQRLAEMMQGEITVTSQPGIGSSFVLELPFEVADVPDPAPAYSLSNVWCVIFESRFFEAAYAAAYIDHAGGTAMVLAAGSPLTAMPASTGPLVLIHDGSADIGPSHVAAAGRRVAELVLLPDHPAKPRADTPHRVLLGADGLRRDILLYGVALAAGQAPGPVPENEPTRTDVTPQPPLDIATARKQGRLILVAEDDDINQKVILRQLALLGYAADVASDGVEALKLWQQHDYALLLTDLHMPNMDGYQLSIAIRRAENGASRLPIIALTANALVGEAQRARAVGIDGYLTKPLQLQALKEELNTWMPKNCDSTHNGTPQPREQDVQTSPSAVVDFTALRALIGDDEQSIRELLADYLKSLRALSAELRGQARSGMAREVGAIAHRLKSSSRSVGARALGDLCDALERAGRAEDQDAITHWLPHFERAVPAVEKAIEQHLAQGRQ